MCHLQEQPSNLQAESDTPGQARQSYRHGPRVCLTHIPHISRCGSKTGSEGGVVLGMGDKLTTSTRKVVIKLRIPPRTFAVASEMNAHLVSPPTSCNCKGMAAKYAVSCLGQTFHSCGTSIISSTSKCKHPWTTLISHDKQKKRGGARKQLSRGTIRQALLYKDQDLHPRAYEPGIGMYNDALPQGTLRADAALATRAFALVRSRVRISFPFLSRVWLKNSQAFVKF